MDFEEFTLRYKLTRRQRLIPHLRVWASHSPEGLFFILLILAFAVFAFIKFYVRVGFIPALISLLIILALPMFFYRGFFIGLFNVLLFRRFSAHLIVKEDTLECSGLLLWFGMSLEGARSFKQYTDDTWTLYHSNGIVITIPSSELTKDQIEHLQGWAKKSEDAAEARHLIRTPQLKNVSGRTRIECYTSKIKLLGLLGMISVLIAASYFLTTWPELAARVVGWIGVGVLGLIFILFSRQLFRTGPQFIFNDEGIEDRRQKHRLIRWEDIRLLSTSGEFLRVDVVNPEEHLSRRPRWKRSLEGVSKALGTPALLINFTVLSPDLNKVWAQLEARDTAHEDGQPAAS